MIDRQACRCASCRTRDLREFERIAETFDTPTRSLEVMGFLWPETLTLAERIGAYSYGTKGAKT
jgi:hypothetical protein